MHIPRYNNNNVMTVQITAFGRAAVVATAYTAYVLKNVCCIPRAQNMTREWCHERREGKKHRYVNMCIFFKKGSKEQKKQNQLQKKMFLKR